MARIQFLLTMHMKDGAKPPSKTKSSLSNSLVEIIRIPKPGEKISGVRKGDPVKGQQVLQYVGPLTLEIYSSPDKTFINALTSVSSKAKKTEKRKLTEAQEGKKVVKKAKKTKNIVKKGKRKTKR